MKPKVIAFYLPQYHPFKENDEWWGKGFTEWTNVGKAKKLYPGHYQPRIPADLGYYDLRIPEVREQQAQLAQEAGIDAFCYWHYWFGNGKQLLERPLQEVISQQKPNFPFCLGWANHSWSKKNWNKDVSRFNNETLIEQTYPGREDIDNHFYTMLPVFQDKRYYRVHGKLLFFIYAPLDLPDIDYFVQRWNYLATENALPNFFFVGNITRKADISNKPKILDGIALDLMGNAFKTNNFSIFKRRLSYLIPFPSRVIRYSTAIKRMIDSNFSVKDIFPVVYPNWDHSPRVGMGATIMHGSTPSLFKVYMQRVLSLIYDKNDEDKIIFIKSWNEWAEGNYLEPDLKFGKEYLNVLAQVLYENRI